MSLPAHDNRLHPSRTPSEYAEFVSTALTRLGDEAVAPLAMIVIPAPVAPLERLLTAAPTAVLWDPPTGPRAVGIGHAVMLTASGPDRISAIARQAASIWSRIQTAVYPGIQPIEPRLFGGFAFAEGAASAAPWRAFGDARFVLPTWLYARDGDHAHLCLTVDLARPELTPSDVAEELAALDKLFGALDPAIGDASERLSAFATGISEPDRALWRTHINDIRAAIQAGHCEKIVAAQCSEVQLSSPVNPTAVLTALERRYRDCYRFAYRFDPGGIFVGATPERLISRAGASIVTQALAGSIAATPDTADEAALALLASAKDRGEQTLVVRAIEDVLRPLCVELDVPAEPEIRALRHVLHLETPIRGRLRAPTHVLDLVEALHPTPAVGGVPTETAMTWIAEREAPRGWYAAPVGWFDASGQGEFAVALRSGLLSGQTAHVYAGAGIVRDSNPDTELAEIKLKQRAVLGALGIAR